MTDAIRAAPADDAARTASERPGAPRAQEHVTGLFRRDSVYVLLWALQLLVAAGLTPVATRVLGAQQFGGVATAVAVMQVVTVICGLGLSTAIQRTHAEATGPRDSRRLFAVSIVGAGAVVVLLDVTGTLWRGLLGFPHDGAALRIAVVWAGLSAVTGAALALLRSEDRLAPFALVSMTQSVVSELAAVGAAAAFGRSATSYLLGQTGAQLLACALALAFVPPAVPWPRHRRLVVRALTYGLPLVPAMLSSYVLGSFDRLVIQHELGSTPVARYQIAYNIGSAPMLLLGVLDTTWMPRIFALGEDRLRTQVIAASRDALYRLLVPVVLGLSVGAPVVLRIWAPAEFRPDGLLPVTTVVIICAVPYAALLSATRALLATGRSMAVAVVSLVAAAVNGVLNVLLVPHLQLLGAALSTAVAYALLHSLLAVLVRRDGAVPHPPAALAGAAALACAGAVATSALPTSPLWLLLRSLGAACCLVWFVAVAKSAASSGESAEAGRCGDAQPAEFDLAGASPEG